jgi:ferredoxin
LTCPEVFEVGLVARVLVEEPADSLAELVREAVDDCPTGAIHIEEAPATGW